MFFAQDYCKVILIGQLMTRPHITLMPSGSEGANFQMKITRHYLDKQKRSQKKDSVVWCSAWGERAAEICRYRDEGDWLFVEGHLESYQIKGVDTLGVVVMNAKAIHPPAGES